MHGNINQITACTVAMAAVTVAAASSENQDLTIPGLRLQTDQVLSISKPTFTGDEGGEMQPHLDWVVTADDTLNLFITNPTAGDYVFAAQDLTIVIGRFDHFIGDGL